MKISIRPKDAKVIGPYSPAIETDGFIFCSGQIPIDSATGQIVEGGIEEQIKQCLKNLTNLLEAAGVKAKDVVKSTVYLTDMNDFAKMNAIYGEYFIEPYPARTAIAVSALPMGANVEIEVIAKKG